MKLALILFACLAVALSLPLEDKKNGLKHDSKEVKDLEAGLKDSKEKESYKKFVDFIKKHHRHYADKDELKKRFKNFQASLEKVQQYQKSNPKGKYGVNKFSDFEPSEFYELHAGEHKHHILLHKL
ncbi:unnamed protein product [Bursaphelenchus xylophilus]|uniref:(pine wood nematode) hypothetical protein n=1 Tax=Bursaphelenchus xylophilus TaxID=6326 RepID=A0A1I7RTK3_BURXY|nr:unnamed protein product [Bursaphelenchus xylophilus]CAG9122376.1 unnamed protein product [Bursaphelenchus xylophilus]